MAEGRRVTKSALRFLCLHLFPKTGLLPVAMFSCLLQNPVTIPVCPDLAIMGSAWNRGIEASYHSAYQRLIP